MRDIQEMQQQLKGTFKVLNGLPDYILIEEKDESIYEQSKIQEQLQYIINAGISLGIKRISAVIHRSTKHYQELSNLMISHGFEPYANKVEVFKELIDLPNVVHDYKWHSISDLSISEDAFKHYWEQCMSDSENEPSTLSMEQYLDSVKSELGDSWKETCKVVFLEGKPLGVTMPHIEPGTNDEGRLFYFGILPEERGKGHSTPIHYQSLIHLKEMGATYYIGNTHEDNVKMQRVFERNGCKVRARTESYYKYFE
ncbi:GNAT family N-acetyltransferase [Pontibacillus marinus]|uniref:Acetyltransferase n=1 Tax=Pontibacillus marinus BH030004 = DSM 16465 TaxID=1385511 RepID=A0A0A5G7H0_9BACI|nr:GNAT family N-acetyltransferase [Pontibacillus marinus]KGX87123.1 acetyltransferase [Pontibacillus marinus BH030004 = DSM 16465]